MMVCCDSQITAEQHPKEREQQKKQYTFLDWALFGPFQTM